MKFKAPFGPTIDQIHTTLANGFDGITLSNGKILTASNTNNSSPSGGRFPFMAFRTGAGTFSPWKDFQWSISWDVPATITVQGPGEDGEISARQVLSDILMRTMQLTGLPLDSHGKLVPLSAATLKLFDDGHLTFLCERGAPIVRSFDVRPIDDGLCEINLVFHIEAVMSFDVRELNFMKVGILGINPVPPGGIFQDPFADNGRGIVRVFQSQFSSTGEDTALDPTIDTGMYNSNQEKPRHIAFVDAISAVNVTPYSASISSGAPTVQLSAIGQNLSYASLYVTSQAQWQSTVPSVATVNASGLVTRVAVGTTVITATYNGVVSNAVTITSL